ncbi:metal ABC transporter permease [Allorhodopirellula heiligendammensis]|uniref:Manganese transport system membrane protein MntB n=1 Tax=Allorhodopirellula heiligendammensis TaxID=2714739 RepID=A0A5C6C5F9_9BACT|nr:metal ABC transporter permease [Allorhodopirellula heiligendammensis]TWU18791.1 Manganese transport system membrane protein MntB [Allorhodopirellula heiligendammensis]
MTWNWQLDGWIVLAGVLCAVASALVGNFLVLRRLSMLGDAVSHAVLPGLAVAFFISNSRSSVPMFVGAVVVGVLTALFTEWIRGVGKVDESASMGVVFTSLFAAGLIMIVQAADKVDLDAGCVLYGAIELTPLDTVTTFGFTLPRAVLVLGVVTLVNLVFVLVFFKELKLTAFDPSLATSMGFSAGFMHYALMVLVAVTAVASFESVGNVLVVAMFIVPPATAYLLTDRLGLMIVLSTVIAAMGAVSGHVAAVIVPTWFGFQSTTTAGMMAVMVGVFFMVAIFFAPRHGMVVKLARRQILSLSILADDIVAFLYRHRERLHESRKTPGAEYSIRREMIAEELLASRSAVAIAMSRLYRQGHLRWADGGCELTEAGTQRARDIVRSHRLWEQYLVNEADMDATKIHDKAEQFEHFTDRPMQQNLDTQTRHPEIDPHGRTIPRPEHDPRQES